MHVAHLRRVSANKAVKVLFPIIAGEFKCGDWQRSMPMKDVEKVCEGSHARMLNEHLAIPQPGLDRLDRPALAAWQYTHTAVINLAD